MIYTYAVEYIQTGTDIYAQIMIIVFYIIIILIHVFIYIYVYIYLFIILFIDFVFLFTFFIYNFIYLFMYYIYVHTIYIYGCFRNEHTLHIGCSVTILTSHPATGWDAPLLHESNGDAGRSPNKTYKIWETHRKIWEKSQIIFKWRLDAKIIYRSGISHCRTWLADCNECVLILRSNWKRCEVVHQFLRMIRMSSLCKCWATKPWPISM